jgi:hypothetical protein
MPKTLLNRSDIEEMVMNELRSFAPCNDVQNVVVVRATDIEGANWRIDSYVADGGPPVSGDCKRRGIEVQQKLQKSFDVIWPN